MTQFYRIKTFLIRNEESREINHHGQPRTVGDDDDPTNTADNNLIETKVDKEAWSKVTEEQMFLS